MVTLLREEERITPRILPNSIDSATPISTSVYAKEEIAWSQPKSNLGQRRSQERQTPQAHCIEPPLL
jgi:hypothetical protein